MTRSTYNCQSAPPKAGEGNPRIVAPQANGQASKMPSQGATKMTSFRIQASNGKITVTKAPKT